MITSSHIIYSWAIAAYTNTLPEGARRIKYILLGALIPDVPTYIFFIVHSIVLGTSHRIMWDQLYFHSAWSIPITLSHSLLLWPFLLALGIALSRRVLVWISASALFHIALDFLVHTSDAYRHFWPISDWTFRSPVSYWNSAEYGTWVMLADALIVWVLLIYVFTVYERWSVRTFIILLGGLYLWFIASEFVF